ncbi:uncharacterized protein LOC128989970 [Macrosteles quadrilineatus]|uniref:uncharacterized protein LOC128989970 n=1 Tax=Macrosteles quadrilineatus TaxID=74068 RepID=UPI0023E1C362|nr:uncharacterized protein LOC128989970 [Macrosteles quadrilineatus]
MTSSSSVLSGAKRCLKVLRTLTNLKRRIAVAVLHEKSAKKPVNQLSQCPFHLSITSLDKHPDSRSIDTVMTWLDEGLHQEVADNRFNERIENCRGFVKTSV